MAELRDCPKCGAFFNYTGLRDVCHKCAVIEEDLYQVVYRFLRKRENRAATAERIVEATGVEQETLYKWVRKGRLQPTLFPNLGYPCDQCGRLTHHGKLCDPCQNKLKADLKVFEAAQEFQENIEKNQKRTYFSERQ